MQIKICNFLRISQRGYGEQIRTINSSAECISEHETRQYIYIKNIYIFPTNFKAKRHYFSHININELIPAINVYEREEV
jgi:hypothetical protein